MADITQGPPNMNSPGLFDIQNYLASLQGSGAQPSAPIAANPRQYTSPAGPPAADTSNPFISDLAGLAKYNKGQDANNLAAQMFMGADDNSPVAPSAAPAVDKYGNKVVYDPDNLTPKIDDARSKALALLQQAQATPAPKMAGMTLPQAALQILAGGLDRSGRTGAGFDQGLNAQDKTAYENAMQQFGHTQQGLQQQAGSLSSTAQALQDAIQKRYATDVGFQGRLQPTLARVGGLLDVQNLKNTNAQTVEQMKQKYGIDLENTKDQAALQLANQQIDALQAKDLTTREEKAMSMLQDPNSTAGMRMAATADLQKIRPSVWGQMSPNILQAAVAQTPVAQQLLTARIAETHANIGEIQSTIQRNVALNRLTADQAQTLEQHIANYPAEEQAQAADTWSQILARMNSLKSGQAGNAQNEEIRKSYQALQNMDQNLVKSIIVRRGSPPDPADTSDPDSKTYADAMARIKGTSDLMKQLADSEMQAKSNPQPAAATQTPPSWVTQAGQGAIRPVDPSAPQPAPVPTPVVPKGFPDVPVGIDYKSIAAPADANEKAAFAQFNQEAAQHAGSSTYLTNLWHAYNAAVAHYRAGK